MKNKIKFLDLILSLLLIITFIQPGLVHANSSRSPLIQTLDYIEPVVAIHVSELTQALASMPAKSPTPTGSGTTGYEWWYQAWRYSVLNDALKEALKSDGIPYKLVSDADIASGRLLLSNGSPRFPILISMSTEAVDNNEITPLRNYVNAGGFILAGSTAFTRNPNGTTRGDFALANEMGLHMVNSSLDGNWGFTQWFRRTVSHRILSHFPSGTVPWLLARSESEYDPGDSAIWNVRVTDATVLATGSGYPLVAIKNYGSGWFVYHSYFNPFIGHGGASTDTFAYLIYRMTIEWAFENAGLPLTKLSAWQYPYDAAMVVRHDFENFADQIQAIEASASVENSVGMKGDYYFTTGTLRAGSADNQLTETQKTTAIQSLRRAVSLYGATIGSHNGGLKNPWGTYAPTEYRYWHWGPDEVVLTYPSGYSSGRQYTQLSYQMSFNDIAGWLSGLDNGRAGCGTANICPRTYVSPYYRGTYEDSREVIEGLGVITSGEQNLGPLPVWAVSYETAGKKFNTVSLPTSEWYINGGITEALEIGWSSGHTTQTIHDGVDFYYNNGLLINFYGHFASTSGVYHEYVVYGATKPRVWKTNAVGIHDWWVNRSPVQIVPTFSKIGSSEVTSISVSGAVDPETALELQIPNWNPDSPSVNIYLNGNLATSSQYRITSTGVKIRIGSTTNTVEIRKGTVLGPNAANDSYTTAEDTGLSVSAPGVLVNDTSSDGSTLTAVLATEPLHGSLVLNANGSFNYSPASNYSGIDTFTYMASAGTSQSTPATVTITITAQNDTPQAFNDSYSTVEDANLTVPAAGVLSNDIDVEGNTLTAQLVTGPTHGILNLSVNGGFTYTPSAEFSGIDSFIYRASDGNTTSEAVIVTIQVQAVNDSPMSVSDSYTTIEDTTLFIADPGVLSNDTDPDSTIQAAILVSATNHGTLNLSSNGGFSYAPATNFYGTDSFSYQASDGQTNGNQVTVQITVTPQNDPPVAASDSYNTSQDLSLTVSAPGVLGNDSDPEGSTLTVTLVAGTANGTLSLYPTGAFAYIPNSGFTGTDQFTYTNSDGNLNSLPAVVTINISQVNTPPVAVSDTYSLDEDIALNISSPGVLGNDTVAENQSLSAILVQGPSHGTLTLNSNGAFLFTPYANYAGSDQFTYQVSDGQATSGTVIVSLIIQPVNDSPNASNDSYSTPANTVLSIAAPGVLSNDTDIDSIALTTSLVVAAAHGDITLDPDGSFEYNPDTDYSGGDSFSYVVNDGSINSESAIVTITIESGNIFSDDFTRPTPPAVVPFSWTVPTASTAYPNRGSFASTYGTLSTSTTSVNNYGYTYAPGVLIQNHSIEADVKFPRTGIYGGGIFGRMSTTNGQRYAVWLYPEGSTGIPSGYSTSMALVKLIKFTNWGAWSYPLGMQSVSVPAVGSDWHHLKVTFTNNQIQVYFDQGTTPIINLTDNNSGGVAPFTTGNVGIDLYGYNNTYGPTFNNFVVSDENSVVTFSDNFGDDFVDPLLPWTRQSGTWSVTNGVLQGSTTAWAFGYSFTTGSPAWTDYSLEGLIRIPAGTYGGGLSGRLNTTTGAHYGVWVFPDDEQNSSGLLQLYKFRTWTDANMAPMASINLSNIGTGWHSLKLVFIGNRIQVIYDGNRLIDVIDNNYDSRAAYLSGGISAQIYATSTSQQFYVDDVVVKEP